MGGALLPQGVGVPFSSARPRPRNRKTTLESILYWPAADTIRRSAERTSHFKLESKSAGAMHVAQAKDALKSTKLTDHDSFLEALDARTGKPLGGALVQSGIGASELRTQSFLLVTRLFFLETLYGFISIRCSTDS